MDTINQPSQPLRPAQSDISLTWPAGFSPSDSNITFAESGIQEQLVVSPGQYWISPDGRMWVVPRYHEEFANAYLGGIDNAYTTGWVRAGYGSGLMYFTATDTSAFDNPAVELLARQAEVIVAVTVADRDSVVQFTKSAWVKANVTFQEYVGYLMDKIKHEAGIVIVAGEGPDKSKVIPEALTVDHLTITFHDKLFDYYLSAPNMDPGWYVTEIGGMKVGFGSKYQLKKFMLKLKTEFFSDGNIPGSNIKIAPIPEIEEPLVRRMGGNMVLPFEDNQMQLTARDLEQGSRIPVIEHGLPPAAKKALEQGAVGPQVWEISEGSEDQLKAVNNRPTGPML